MREGTKEATQLQEKEQVKKDRVTAEEKQSMQKDTDEIGGDIGFKVLGW